MQKSRLIPIATLIASSVFINSHSHAELIKDGVWQVNEGDKLNTILADSFKGQPLRQQRLSRLIPRISPKAFDQAGNLVPGQTLRLPGAKLKSNSSKNVDVNIAGRVLASSGTIFAKNSQGKTRALKQGANVKSGDKIITFKEQAQIRFTDGSLMALKPNTELMVEEYKFNGKIDGSEKSIYNLVKGSLRTLSGAIGKTNKQNYQMKTPVATIGIRGTDYVVTFCSDGSCGDLPDGLYCAVADGEIVAATDGQSWTYGKDNYFFIDSKSKKAKTLLKDPGVMFVQTRRKKSNKDEGSSSTENQQKRKKRFNQTRKQNRQQNDIDPQIDNPLARRLINGKEGFESSRPILPARSDTKVSFALISQEQDGSSPYLSRISRTGTNDGTGNSTAIFLTDISSTNTPNPKLAGLVYDDQFTYKTVRINLNGLSDQSISSLQDLGLYWGVAKQAGSRKIIYKTKEFGNLGSTYTQNPTMGDMYYFISEPENALISDDSGLIFGTGSATSMQSTLQSSNLINSAPSVVDPNKTITQQAQWAIHNSRASDINSNNLALVSAGSSNLQIDFINSKFLGKASFKNENIAGINTYSFKYEVNANTVLSGASFGLFDIQASCSSTDNSCSDIYAASSLVGEGTMLLNSKDKGASQNLSNTAAALNFVIIGKETNQQNQTQKDIGATGAIIYNTPEIPAGSL